MQRALAEFEGDGNLSGTVGFRTNLHCNGGENSERQQVLARFFDLARAVLLAGMQEKPLAHERLVHALQAPDANLADVDARPGDHVKADIEHPVCRILVGDRGIDFRESVAIVFERRLEAVARGEDLRGHRRRAALQRQCVLHRLRQLAVDVDAAHVIEVPQAECYFHASVVARRLRRQLFAQGRIVERQVVDGDCNVALVIAVAFQHGLEAIQVAAGPADEAEGPHGRGAAQADEIGSRLERGIHLTVTGGREIDLVGLRIGGAGRCRDVVCDRRKREDRGNG